MNLDKIITFRTAKIVEARAAAISHENNIKYSELLRVMFSHGVKNAEKVSVDKREDLTLEEALLLQSVGAEYK